MNRLLIYIFVLIPMAVLDAFWLSTMTSRFYRPLMGGLLNPTLQVLPAFLFYAMYGAGTAFFVVAPAIKGQFSLPHTWLQGAFLGLIAYGAYDFTNQATLKNWSWTLTIVDMAWGCFITGTCSVIAVLLYRYFVLHSLQA